MTARMASIERIFEETYDGLVAGVTSRFGDAGLAEDQVHDAFVKLMARPDVVEGDSAGGWLNRVSSNGAKRHRTRLDRRRGFTDPSHLEWIADAEDQVGPLLDQQVLRQCLEALPARQRDLLLDFADAMPVDQMAEKHGVQPASVRVLVHRAIKRLRSVAEQFGLGGPQAQRSWALLPSMLFAKPLTRLRALVRRADPGLAAAMMGSASTVVALGVAAMVAPGPVDHGLDGGAVSSAVPAVPASTTWRPAPITSTTAEVADGNSPGPTTRADRERDRGEVVAEVGGTTIRRGGAPMEAPTFVVRTPVGGFESDDVPPPPAAVPPPCIAGSGWC